MVAKKRSTIIIVSKNNGELIRSCCEECFISQRVALDYEVCEHYEGCVKDGNAIIIDNDLESLKALTKEEHTLVGFFTDEKTLVTMSDALLKKTDRIWTITKAEVLERKVLLIFLKKLADAVKLLVRQKNRFEMTEAGMKIMLEQVPMGVLIYDEMRVIRFSNNHFEKILQNRSEVIDKKLDVWKNSIGLEESFIDPARTMMFEYNGKVYQYRECDALSRDSVIFGGLVLIRDMTKELRYTELLEKEIEKTDQKLQKTSAQVARLSEQAYLTLASTIDAKDKYTNGHSLRVAEYSKEIARRAGSSAEEIEIIYYMGLLHDIGKIGVPDEIINKTSRLTDEEFARIKEHPTIGFDILSNMADLPEIAVGAKYHHEKYNGTGYPEGLKGEEIPMLARMIGVADAFDAMNSNRSYRNGLPMEVILSELEKNKGIQFDPEYAQIMIDMINDGFVS